MKISTQRGISTGLMALNALGVVATFIFVAKETPNAQRKIESAKETKFAKLKAFVSGYKKSLIFASATIASGIGSRVLSSKTESGLLAGTAMLGTTLHKYKSKVKETLGIDADKSIIKELMKEDKNDISKTAPKDGQVLYYEEHIGYFYAKPEDVMYAYSTINKDLSGNNNWYVDGIDSRGYETIGDFLNLCQGEPLDITLDDAELNFGWSSDYLGEYYENYWVNMDISEPDDNFNGARMIYFYADLVWNPEQWYDYIYNGLNKNEYFKGADKNLSFGAQYYIPSNAK